MYSIFYGLIIFFVVLFVALFVILFFAELAKKRAENVKFLAANPKIAEDLALKKQKRAEKFEKHIGELKQATKELFDIAAEFVTTHFPYILLGVVVTIVVGVLVWCTIQVFG